MRTDKSKIQVAIFKIVWAVWRRFERYTMTAEIFGQKCYDEKVILSVISVSFFYQILLHSHECAARFGNYYIDYSNVSDQGFERFNKLVISVIRALIFLSVVFFSVFGGKMIQYYDIIVKPYLEMQLSPTEITYILCQIVWNYAGRRLQGQTQAAGERFLEVISNNLHQHYEGLPDVENYAGRLGKMMQMVNQMLVSFLIRW